MPGQYQMLETQQAGSLNAIEISSRQLELLVREDAPHVASVALVPLLPNGVHGDFIERLAHALAPVSGRTFHVSSGQIERDLGRNVSTTRAADQLSTYADEFSCLLLECDPGLSPWTSLCLAQADLILVVAPSTGVADCETFAGGVLNRELSRARKRKELVLVHPDNARLPSGTSRWLRAISVEAHHHVRSSCTADYERLARSAVGKSVSVVLSGGGARGLAHLGALQALQHCGVPIDSIGGTSMGSLVAAHWAMGLEIGALYELAAGFSKNFRRSFVRDLTFRAVAPNSAHQVTTLLKHAFGEIEIEDLWIPFFCNSSDLNSAEVTVHADGPLWAAIRASCSLPGVWPPVIRDGRMLVDGGILNNLPVDIMRARCGGTVIAINVSPTVEPTVNSFAGQPGVAYTVQAAKRNADLFIQPPTAHVDFFDWKSAYKLIEIAFKHCREEIQAWKR